MEESLEWAKEGRVDEEVKEIGGQISVIDLTQIAVIKQENLIE